MPDFSETTPISLTAHPNVVWILIDTLRPDHLGAYGYKRKTSPNIDELARLGVLFEEHYAQGQNTINSVPTMLSGKYYPVYLQNEYLLDVWFLREQPDDEILAPQLFAQNGYATGMFTASPWYTAESRLARTFQSFRSLTSWDKLTGVNFRGTNPELFSWIEEKRGEPFFAYIHTLDAHEPRTRFNTNDTWLDGNFPRQRDMVLRRWAFGQLDVTPNDIRNEVKGGRFSDADKAHIQNLYDGGVAFADQTVGEIVRYLKELNIYRNTIIVISSDHGEVLAEDNNTLGHPVDGYSDEQLRVPLIFSGPGIPRDFRISHRTQNVDIMPTLVELLGLQHSAKFDGKSLYPLITGAQTEAIHEHIYAKTGLYSIYEEPLHVVYRKNFKYLIPKMYSEYIMKPWSHITEKTNVWQLPGSIKNHNKKATSGYAFSDVREFVTNFVGPLWVRYDKLPRITPPMFQMKHSEISPMDAVTEDSVPIDGKWTKITIGNWLTPSSTVFYEGARDTEVLPPISGTMRVPNGKYRISTQTKVVPKNLAQKYQASSFRFSTRGVEEFKLYILESDPDETTILKWIELGEIEVTDGIFSYHFGPGRPGDMTVFGGLRFQRLDAEDRRDLNFESINAELEALGYLN